MIKTLKSNCRSFPGSYNCLCPQPNQIQDCKATNLNDQKAPQNVYFYYNPLAILNEPQKYLVVVEKLGTINSTLEISTKNYVMVNFQFNKFNIREFELISNRQLMEVAKKLKIRNVDVPHANVYFAVFSRTLVELGDHKISVKVTKFGSRRQKIIFYNYDFDVKVYKSPDLCYPKISMDNW